MSWQPRASHAAGTVSHTSAESAWARGQRRATQEESESTARPRTEVGHGTNLACDLLFGVVPQTGEEVDDEIDGLLPRL